MANEEAIQIWADALRFKNYQQIRGSLSEGRGDDQSFCGLGVACAEYAEKINTSPRAVIASERGVAESHLPFAVREWLDISTEDEMAVVKMNDHQDLTLSQIGEWVADNLLKKE